MNIQKWQLCGQESFNVLNPLCFFLPIVRLSDVLSVGGCSQGQGQLQEVL